MDGLRGWIGARRPSHRSRLEPEAFAQDLGISVEDANHVFRQALKQGVLEKAWELKCPACTSVIIIPGDTSLPETTNCIRGHTFRTADVLDDASSIYRYPMPFFWGN